MMNVYEIQRTLPNQTVGDWQGQIHKELARHLAKFELPKGASIAITAGSRGIHNIVGILREIVRFLKDKGWAPFIVPAMGSHGGATAEGQIEVLKGLGITETSMAAPIRSSMDVLQIGSTKSGLPVYMDRYAYHADGIIVVNRIKVHTAFRGNVESGLSKMVTIGLGKQKGASFVHQEGPSKMYTTIRDVAAFALEHAPILMGLGIVENGYEETAAIVGVSKEEWFEKEAELLKLSKSLMPQLPLDQLDLLIVEEMGKNFSGTGMDPNVIGRWQIRGVPEPERPVIKSILVLDLHEKSYGNAQGIGLADFTTKRLVDKINRQATYMNALTSTYIQRAMIPLYYDTEAEAVEAAIKHVGHKVSRAELKMIQIPNTLQLERMYVSESALNELRESDEKFTILRTFPFAFNEKGDLQYKLSSHMASGK